nr:hypothetical protein [Tanacetum cinerariifolium]
EGVDDAVVDVELFRLCFDDRADCAEDTELEFEALDDARDRVRSRTDVAGDESAEKWLPVVYVLLVEFERFGGFDGALDM